MTHIETLRARLSGLATEVVNMRNRVARGEEGDEVAAAAERRFRSAMAEIAAEEFLAMLGVENNSEFKRSLHEPA